VKNLVLAPTPTILHFPSKERHEECHCEYSKDTGLTILGHLRLSNKRRLEWVFPPIRLPASKGISPRISVDALSQPPAFFPIPLAGPKPARTLGLMKARGSSQNVDSEWSAYLMSPILGRPTWSRRLSLWARSPRSPGRAAISSDSTMIVSYHTPSWA